MTVRECTRCNGHRYICPACGAPRSQPRRCKSYLCQSRARSVPCPGEKQGRAYSYPTKFAAKTEPHFHTEYTCDGCGVVALHHKPEVWVYYSAIRGASTMHLCEDCEKRRTELVATAFDRLLEERGGSMAGVGWKPPNERVQYGPVKPEWLQPIALLESPRVVLTVGSQRIDGFKEVSYNVDI